MKRLLWAVGLVVMAASSAMARTHNSGFLGINMGFPLYFYPSPPTSSNPAPQAYPVASAPNGFYHAPPKVYRQADGERWVVEEIYRDGRLVERRVKCYPPDWEGYR